jgi:hypothetical protein
MLLKPVQRVLKYPLLLSELRKGLYNDSAVTDSEKQIIENSIASMTQVAEHINEVKRRKDVVEKIISGKGEKSIQHGFQKGILNCIAKLKSYFRRLSM